MELETVNSNGNNVVASNLNNDDLIVFENCGN
jgi:hypothetical protein